MEFRVDQCFSLESKPMSYDSKKDMEPCRETLASECSDTEQEQECFPVLQSTVRHK